MCVFFKVNLLFFYLDFMKIYKDIMLTLCILNILVQLLSVSIIYLYFRALVYHCIRPHDILFYLVLFDMYKGTLNFAPAKLYIL
jgi:hypothetical protein